MPDQPETITLPKTELDKLKADLETKTTREKSLSRELSRLRQRTDNSGAFEARFAGMEKGLQALFQLVAAGPDADESVKARAARVMEESQVATSGARLQGFYQDKIEETLQHADVEWGDDKLTKARDLWERGKWDEAEREATKVAVETAKTSKPVESKRSSIEDEVRRQVDEEMKKSGIRKVDTKESTTGGSTTGVTREDFASLSAGPGKSVKKLKGQLDEFYERYFKT